MSSAVHFAAADMPLGVMSGRVPAEFASGAVAVNLVATGGDKNAAGWLPLAPDGKTGKAATVGDIEGLG